MHDPIYFIVKTGKKFLPGIKGGSLNLLCLLVMISGTVRAQDPDLVDTLRPKTRVMTSAVMLGDTLWWALQQKTTDDVMTLLPSLPVLKETFDTLEIKNNPQVIRIKYNYITHRVRKQLKYLNSKAKSNKLKFKTCELDKVSFQEGVDPKGNPYAYVRLDCHKSKREFSIKFVALKLMGGWYLVDELKLEFPEDDPFYRKKE